MENQEKQLTFNNTCVYCGKKFTTENFFIEVCPKCQNEYINFLIKSHKKIEKDWY